MAVKRLHFSLGPVQSFVNQARRTRDLWAGSFLLSYLSGHAMHTVIKHGGGIEFPIVTDSSGRISDLLLQAIHQKTTQGPHIGSIPNRFVAKIPHNFQPLWCLEAINSEWTKIANAVWQQFIEPVSSLGSHTRAIWSRQIAEFWDTTWVIGEELDLLDRRKNWRTQSFPIEAGRKCSMMPSWQEISGHITNRRDREKFWTALRNTIVHRAGRLELQEGEELSAIALVKRLFPFVAKDVIGWTVPLSYRSTADLAAKSWVYDLCGTRSEECTEFARVGQKFVRANKPLPMSLRKIADDNPLVKSFMQMDANAWYHNTLLNENLWGDEDTHDIRAQLASRLPRSPSPDTYFAILLMDGDHLGRMLRTHAPHKVSDALKAFTEVVPNIVRDYDGELIYAGGDDVLALFSVKEALQASIALHDYYVQAMEHPGTISAALVYAYYHAPLTDLIQHAHSVLDQVAKEQNGRDSLAFSIVTSGGPSGCWAAKWSSLQTGSLNRLEHLASQVGSQISSQFLFKIDELETKLGSLNDDEFWKRMFAYELARTRDGHTSKQPDDNSIQEISQLIVDASRGHRLLTPHESRYKELLHLIHFLSKRMRSDG